MSDQTATTTAASSEHQLPQVRESTRVTDVFRLLSQKRVGGFLLIGGGRAPRHVKGVDLANAMFALQGVEPPKRGELTVGKVLQQRSALTGDNISVEVMLNTPPPVFRCSNNPPHENQEWTGDGYCNDCPFPLASAHEGTHD